MIDLLVEYTHLAYEKGYVGGTGGNTSVRIGERMLITTTGCTLREVSKDNLAEVDLQTGECVNGKRPSKEVQLHRRIYLERPDLQAIFHLHPTVCIAAILTLAEEDLLPCYVPGHLNKIGRPEQIPYFPAGSEKLADETAKRFVGADCAWMRRHGIITGGKTAREAFLHAEDMIDACRIHMLLKGDGCMNEEAIADFLNKK